MIVEEDSRHKKTGRGRGGGDMSCLRVGANLDLEHNRDLVVSISWGRLFQSGRKWEESHL